MTTVEIIHVSVSVALLKTRVQMSPSSLSFKVLLSFT